MSRVRQNFHEESEALINKQINMEMHASYVYLAMVSNMLGFMISRKQLITGLRINVVVPIVFTTSGFKIDLTFISIHLAPLN